MSKAVGSAKTSFVWDSAGTLPQLLRDGANAYLYGPGGQPLELIRGGTVVWLHHDQLGSTRAMTDYSGRSVAAYTYDSYGNALTSTGKFMNPMRYVGQYRDGESGLYYLRARYYEPATAQFVGVDPAVAQTLSPYAYVAGDPLNATDPSGLYDYQYDFRVGSASTTGGASSTMTYLQQHLGSLFPFSTGNCAVAQSGAKCNLSTFGQTAPVSVTTGCTDFTFSALPGHFDEPGSTITFSTYEQGGEVYLRETAHARTQWFFEPLAPVLAYVQWRELAGNLRSAVNPNGYDAQDAPSPPWWWSAPMIA